MRDQQKYILPYTETELKLNGQHWIIYILQFGGRGFCPLRGDLTGVVCISPYYMSTPQCLELAYPAERSRKRQTDRQTEALYSSNKVHLKLIKTSHKKTLPFEFEKPQLICCVLCSWGVLAFQTASGREATRFCV